MSNFHTEEEKYFAACVLDQLIYRSEEQTLSLIEQLFSRVIPDLTRRDPTPFGSLKNVLARLQSDILDPGIRIVAVLKRRDPPGKSADIICRYLKRDFSVNNGWFITPSEIDAEVGKGIKTFFFVDDFLGTGQQFDEVLTDAGLNDSYLKRGYFAYLPLVTHTEGVTFLRSQYGSLRIGSVEQLDNSYDIFGSSSSCFDDNVNTPDSAKEFYLDFLNKRGFSYSEKCGFGSLGLAYIFQHAAPDNSLPILWWNEDGWTRLFPR